MKLGRIPSGPTPHLPALATYAATEPLPEPPDVVDWTDGLFDWPLLANDRLGDCTVAGVLHYIQAATRWRDGAPIRATDDEAEDGYRALGWDGIGEGNGAMLSDVMQRWQSAGFLFSGAYDRITSFARVEPEHLKAALWLAGPIIIGANMPIAAQTQPVWPAPASLDGDNAPGSWGGHCMLLVGLDAAGSARLVTWGGIRLASAGWISTYVDEAWAALHPAWVASGRSPSGWLADRVAAVA